MLMQRAIRVHALLLMLAMAGFPVNAGAEAVKAGERMPVGPATCQETITELQNQLHAANQTIEILHHENRQLRETLNRIRREVNGGGIGPAAGR